MREFVAGKRVGGARQTAVWLNPPPPLPSFPLFPFPMRVP
jgi:hypothetical protein